MTRFLIEKEDRKRASIYDLISRLTHDRYLYDAEDGDIQKATANRFASIEELEQALKDTCKELSMHNLMGSTPTYYILKYVDGIRVVIWHPFSEEKAKKFAETFNRIAGEKYENLGHLYAFHFDRRFAWGARNLEENCMINPVIGYTLDRLENMFEMDLA